MSAPWTRPPPPRGGAVLCVLLGWLSTHEYAKRLLAKVAAGALGTWKDPGFGRFPGLRF